ncbi:LacI family DNA-binding transcriptional regulator [Streptomyces sp. NPDC101227]|uniref:LacI family DNA-binding transcriptional regulator n=1 Tax=Streptomyces sp. NPDC101227 TaxID=3366136 RepID=UPI0038023535
MTTMVDVARRAGVSVVTVPRAPDESRPVRPSTRAAALGTVDELGRTHHTSARRASCGCPEDAPPPAAPPATPPAAQERNRIP